MHANGQRTHLGAFEDRVDIFMRQLEVLACRHLELNQADVVVAGDNTRPGTGRQHAFNTRRALIRGVTAAQLEVDIAAGNRLQRARVQYRRGQTRQLAGFVETQQRQQAGIFHLTRVRAVHTGHVAPDGDAGHARQGTNLRCRVVRTVTAQQHGFARVAAADKAGDDNTFARVLHEQLLQQRVGQPFIHLRLRGAFGAQEITRVEPGRFHAQVLQHGGHQARGPHFTVAHHFGIHRVGNPAVQQGSQSLKVMREGADQPVRHVRRQQAGNQLALVTA